MKLRRFLGVFWVISVVVLWLCFSGIAQEKVTIKYAFWGNPTAIGVEEDILREFHQEYPHIQVEPIATPYDDYHTKILTMIAGGLAPDVMRIDSYYFADFMEAQVFMPLDDLIKRDEIDLSLYYEIGLPDSMYEGKMYGLPWGTAPLYLAYNVKMFQDAGVSLPKLGWTWDEFVEGARTISGGEGPEHRYGYGDPFSLTSSILPFVWSAGGDIFDESRTQFTLDEPETLERLNEVANLIQEGVFANPLELRPQDANVRLMGNNLIAVIGASAMQILTLQAIEGLDFGIIHQPTGDGIPNTTVVKSNTVSISNTSQHVEEAWEFLKFLRAPGGPGDYLYAQARRIPPTSKIPELWDLYVDPTKPPKDIQEVTLAISSTYGRELPLRKGWLEIEGILMPTLEKVWTEELDAEEALGQIKPSIERIMQR